MTRWVSIRSGITAAPVGRVARRPVEEHHRPALAALEHGGRDAGQLEASVGDRQPGQRSPTRIGRGRVSSWSSRSPFVRQLARRARTVRRRDGRSSSPEFTNLRDRRGVVISDHARPRQTRSCSNANALAAVREETPSFA